MRAPTTMNRKRKLKRAPEARSRLDVSSAMRVVGSDARVGTSGTSIVGGVDVRSGAFIIRGAAPAS